MNASAERDSRAALVVFGATLLAVQLVRLDVYFTHHTTYLKYFLFHLGLAAMALHAALAGRPWGRALRGPFAAALAAWVAWNFASILWSAAPSVSLIAAADSMLYAAWAILVAEAFTERGRLAAAAKTAAIAGAAAGAAAAASFIRSFIASGIPPKWVSFPSGNSNTLGAAILLPAVVSIGLLIEAAAGGGGPGRRRRIFLWGAAGILTVGGLYFAGTLAAWVGFAAAGFVAAQFRLPRRMRRALNILAAGGAAAAAAIFTLAPGPRESLERYVFTSTAAVRYHNTFTGLAMLRARPATGWGAGMFPYVSQSYQSPEAYQTQFMGDRSTQAHNEYLETADELGIVGLLLLGAVLLGAYAGAARAARGDEDPAAANLAVLLAGALAGSAALALFSPAPRIHDYTPLFWTTIGLAGGAGVAFRLPGWQTGRAAGPAEAPAYHGRPEPRRRSWGWGWGVLFAAVLAGIFFTSLPGLNVQVRLAVSRKLWRDGGKAAAVKLLEGVGRPGSSHYVWYTARAYLGKDLAATGETSRAVSIFEELDRLSPNDPETNIKLGELYRREGRHPEAFARACLALRLNPYSIRTRGFLAERLKDFDLPETLRMIDALPERLNFTGADRAYVKSMALELRGRPEEALEVLMSAAESALGSRELAAGGLLLAVGKTPQGARMIAGYARANPYDPMGHYEMACALEALGAEGARREMSIDPARFDGIVEAHLRKAFELRKADENFCVSLAGFLGTRGKLKEAVEVLKAGYARSPDSPGRIKYAADLLRKLGDPAGADALIEGYNDSHPNDLTFRRSAPLSVP